VGTRVQLLFLLGLTLAASFARGQGDFQPSVAAAPANVDTSKIYIDQRLGNQIPLDATFKDQTGAAVTFGDVVSKRPTLALLIFYRCRGVCSVEFAELLKNLSKMPSKKVGRDFDVTVLSIDPQEGPDLAKGKLQEAIDSSKDYQDTQPGWHFLTGDLTQIHKVSDALGFHFTYDEKTDTINHPAGIMFIGTDGKISSYILGAKFPPEAISKNLDIAAKHEVGQKAQDIFFGCIHVDPLTGKRSLAIEAVMRLFAWVTLFGVIATIATLSYRSRRRSAI